MNIRANAILSDRKSKYDSDLSVRWNSLTGLNYNGISEVIANLSPRNRTII